MVWGVRGHPRSSETSPFDRAHMTSYSTLIQTISLSCTVFTARRYAKRGICRRRVSVCVWLCVCLFVTLRYCIKTAKHRITQITPHDSPGILVFWHQSSRRNSNGITPSGGDKCRWVALKFVTFDEKGAITRKRYKIEASFLLKSNRKSYVLYRMAMFPMTLGDPDPPKPPQFLHFWSPFISS